MHQMKKSKNLLALLQHKLVEIIVIFVEGQFSTGKSKRMLSGANTLNTLSSMQVLMLINVETKR